LQRLLIANRGALIPRIARSARKLGIETVAVYSDADADRACLAAVDRTVGIGGKRPSESYLRIDAILEVADRVGADAIHPGYGFLAENADFAASVRNSGRIFVGPSCAAIEKLGNKVAAKQVMSARGLPVSPTLCVTDDSPDAAEAAGREIGFPLIIKPANGGGGIGMTAVHAPGDLLSAIKRASSLATNSFGTGDIYLERLLERPRHIEFQIVSDGQNAQHFFERDCSVQRRFQKVIEESPAPGLNRVDLDEMATRAAQAMLAEGYDHIGTVEMLYEPASGFAFLEVNARLQVEHGVTEATTGIDLVDIQLRLARGERATAMPARPAKPEGHAIEARICAEDPVTFFPSCGTLHRFRPPEIDGVRIETGYAQGEAVTPYYDPLLAKVIVHRSTRDAAIDDLIDALSDFDVEGVKTNIPFLLKVLRSTAFRSGALHTGLIHDLS
jgi:acetyl-CoA carboxylase, biotin carboxylase subunit